MKLASLLSEIVIVLLSSFQSSFLSNFHCSFLRTYRHLHTQYNEPPFSLLLRYTELLKAQSKGQFLQSKYLLYSWFILRSFLSQTSFCFSESTPSR